MLNIKYKDEEWQEDINFDETNEESKISECGICLIDFEKGERIVVLKCPVDNKAISEKLASHIFHPLCIFEWWKKKAECPLCRHSYL